MSGHAEGAHASPKFYTIVGIILAILTAMEISAFYIPFESHGLEVTILLVLSAIKFVMVVGYFMHLKFDHNVFTVVFVAGLALAVFMVSALFVLYQFVPNTTPEQFLNV